jgi:hypothetical protein
MQTNDARTVSVNRRAHVASSLIRTLGEPSARHCAHPIILSRNM